MPTWIGSAPHPFWRQLQAYVTWCAPQRPGVYHHGVSRSRRLPNIQDRQVSRCYRESYHAHAARYGHDRVHHPCACERDSTSGVLSETRGAAIHKSRVVGSPRHLREIIKLRSDRRARARASSLLSGYKLGVHFTLITKKLSDV